MAWEKNDISFKTLINKRSSDSNKNFYEEFGDNTINVHFRDVWVSFVPNDPCIGIPSHIDFYNKHTLIEDPTVDNGLTWTAVTNPSNPFSFTGPDDETNPRLKDWISDKYGLNYEIKVFSNGTEIQKTSQDYPWFFNYQTGELLFNNQSPPEPIQITGYQYNGIKGIIGDTDASGTTSQTFQLYNTNDGVILKDVSGNLEIKNYNDSEYVDITSGGLNVNTSENDFAVVNIFAPSIEDLQDSYFVVDNSIFNGTYIHPPASGESFINDKKAYSTIDGGKSLYFANNNWILREIDSSLLSINESIDWASNMFFNQRIYGVYFGNTAYYGESLKIYNYDSIYKLALNIEGDVDILGNLGVHGKIVAQHIQLDPSYNGVLVAENGNIKSSKYPKTKTFDTSIYGNNITSSFVIDHSINTINHIINIYDLSNNEEIFPDKIIGQNSDTLNFFSAPKNTDNFKVIVIGF